MYLLVLPYGIVQIGAKIQSSSIKNQPELQKPASQSPLGPLGKP